LTTIKELIVAFLDEVKCILKEYVNQTENAIKKRLKKILVTGIIVSVLLALAIVLIGAAALFLLVGALKYLSTFMPAWEAWTIMGLTAGVIGGLLLLALFLVIRKRLKTQ
jgi:di/tricarboxylate transporter